MIRKPEKCWNFLVEYGEPQTDVTVLENSRDNMGVKKKKSSSNFYADTLHNSFKIEAANNERLFNQSFNLQLYYHGGKAFAIVAK